MFTIKVYEPLAGGLVGAFIKAVYANEVRGYSHSHAANIGCDSASFELIGETDDEADDWTQRGLLRHIEVYDDSLELVWAGAVNTVQGTVGELNIVRGPAMEIANKVTCAYSAFVAATVPPSVGSRQFTAWAEDTYSQDKFGIIEYVHSLGGVTVDEAVQVRDLVLYESAYADNDDDFGGGGLGIKIDCLGYGHFLKLYTYNSETAGEVDASVKFTSVIAAEPNGIFSGETLGIETNTTPVAAGERAYRRASDIVTGIVGLGDASLNRWLWGIDANRNPYYRVVSDTPYYERSILEDGEIYLAGSGAIEPPQRVKAGQWLAYNDLMVGTRTEPRYRSDPRFRFIESVTFTAPNGLQIRGSKHSKISQKLSRLGLSGGTN